LTAEDLYQLRFVSDAQLSPDGSRVAYVVAWVDREDRTRYRSQIMLVPFDGSERPRPLTSGRHRDLAPRWSPDGCTLAFLSDRDAERPQVFVLELRGGEPRQVTSLKRGAGVPVWSPAGDRIAFSARVDVDEIARQEGQSEEKGKQPRVKVITHVRHKADGEGFNEALRKHLFVVTPAEGCATRQLTDGDWDDVEPAWSPDGASIAFTSNRERDRDLSLLNDVWVTPSVGGRARRLTRHRGQASEPTFSPDGTRVIYLGHERGWTYGAATQLLAVPTAGGDSVVLSAGFVHELGNVALSDARDPVAAQPLRVLGDGAVLALVSKHGRVEVFRFAPDGSTPETVLGGEREVAAFSASLDGNRLACVISDPTHPYEVVAAGPDGCERRLSFENEAFLEGVEVAPAERFDFASTDGETVYGWLMKPRGFSERKRWPLVLEVHGGPETMYAATFMHEF
jgi:dipeptidyl aminopeptidase/acylaminoacyl peptidase